MSKEKRFYWLKLDRNFFKRHDIRIIEAYGKEYVLFYLKMLAESIDHDGALRFSEDIPYDEQMLSVITSTDKEIVARAIELFTKLGIVKIEEDGTIFMTELPGMIGSETDAAVRVRKMRQKSRKPKKALHCNDERNNVTPGVTLLHQCNADVTPVLRQCYDDVTPVLRKCYADVTQSKSKSKSKSKNKNKNKIENTSPNGDEVVDGFDLFWSVYPRKVGKKDAIKAWSKLKPDENLLKAIIEGVKRWKASEQWKKDGGQFIPYPATFLRGERWNDECQPAVKNYDDEEDFLGR